MRTRSYEDVSGFFRDLEIPVEDADARALEDCERDEVEAVLDAAVGRGAIASSERANWRRYFSKEPHVIREILESLPGRPAQAERAFEHDERLRDLTEQWLDRSGIEREEGVRAYDEDDERNLLDPTGILHLSPEA